MAKRRRSRFLNPFGLAFLDVMSCGLGAAVLLFLIIDHNLTELAHASESGEADMHLLEQAVREQEDLAAEHRRQKQQLRRELQRLAQERIAAITAEAQLSPSRPQASDTRRLEAEVRRMQQKLQEAKTSLQMRARSGEGQRQYVAGFRMEGRRILILVDRSASMTDARIAAVIRNKFLPVGHQKQSYKWRWTRSILEWMLAHLPKDAQYQVWGFDVDAEPVRPGWLLANDARKMQDVIDAVAGWVPSGGTRLDTAFEKIARLAPRPDAVYMITDGLPTQGSSLFGKVFRSARVNPQQRMEFFEDATRNIDRPPFGIVLLPLEGDPQAAGAYWRFAMQTNGQFLAPSEDWP